MPAWMHGQDVSAGSQCGADVCVRGWRCVCTVGVCCGDVYMPMDAYGWHPDTHVLLVRSHLEVRSDEVSRLNRYKTTIQVEQESKIAVVLCIWYGLYCILLYIVLYSTTLNVCMHCRVQCGCWRIEGTGGWRQIARVDTAVWY